jgi:hypothetical protein
MVGFAGAHSTYLGYSNGAQSGDETASAGRLQTYLDAERERVAA